MTLTRGSGSATEPFQGLPAGPGENPFLTRAYADYRRARGERPLIVRLPLAAGEVPILGFEHRGRVHRQVEIPSRPAMTEEEAWRALPDLLRRAGATRVAVNSFASKPAVIPPLVGEVARWERREYVLDLESWDPVRSIGSNHRRTVGRGEKAGLTLSRRGDAAAAAEHARLSRASMARRRTRGEAAAEGIAEEEAASVLTAGAGEIFQALAGTEVLSSILLLRSPRGAYYHSAGSAPEGMACGAAHWLIVSSALQLRSEGIARFNLGGVGPASPGLDTFKAGFGSRRVDLEALQLSVGTPLTWAADALLRYRRRARGRSRRDAGA